MAGIIGKKVGMTSVFSADGKNMSCTVVEAGPCVVLQVKTPEKDGYKAIQVGFGDKKEHRSIRAELGHAKKANTLPKKKVVEFRDYEGTFALGDVITAESMFKDEEYVDVVGTSKGKGFQGVVRRHNFAGVGGQTHGQHNRLRAPGSVGASSFPSRVFPGTRMAGQMGNDRVKVMNLQIVKVIPQSNLIVIKGSIPGSKGSYIILEK